MFSLGEVSSALEQQLGWAVAERKEMFGSSYTNSEFYL
jgi:hypothetical protein